MKQTVQVQPSASTDKPNNASPRARHGRHVSSSAHPPVTRSAALPVSGARRGGAGGRSPTSDLTPLSEHHHHPIRRSAESAAGHRQLPPPAQLASRLLRPPIQVARPPMLSAWRFSRFAPRSLVSRWVRCRGTARTACVAHHAVGGPAGCT